MNIRRLRITGGCVRKNGASWEKGVGRELGETWQILFVPIPLSVPDLKGKDAPFLWVWGEGALAQEGLWLTSGEGQRVLAYAVSQIPSA